MHRVDLLAKEGLDLFVDTKDRKGYLHLNEDLPTALSLRRVLPDILNPVDHASVLKHDLVLFRGDSRNSVPA